MQCTAALFEKVTGARFCDAALITPDHLLQWWQSRPLAAIADPRDKAFRSLQKKRYEQIRQNPAQLVLCDQATAGWGVKAGERIEKSRGLCFYGGEFVSEEKREALTQVSELAYLFSDVDARDFRNYGPMFNDGFPNAFPTEALRDGGVSNMLVSIADIKPGESIVYDYGHGHPVKFKYRRSELNPEGLQAFIESRAPLLSAFLSQASLDLKDLVYDEDLFTEYTSLQYIINTPTTMMDLVGKGLLPVDLMRALFAKAHLLNLTEDQIQLARLAVDIATNLSESEGALGEASLSIREMCTRWSNSLAAFAFTPLLGELAQVKTQAAWEAFLQDLGPFEQAMQAVIDYEVSEGEERYLNQAKEAASDLRDPRKINLLDMLVKHFIEVRKEWKMPLSRLQEILPLLS